MGPVTAPRIYAVSDDAYLEAHPRASAAVTVQPCGGGLTQPGEFEPCTRPGAWAITYWRGGRHYHTYCSEHARRRLDAADRLAATARRGD